jgi:RimJ/RimL family protein N-acetyltransferase
MRRTYDDSASASSTAPTSVPAEGGSTVGNGQPVGNQPDVSFMVAAELRGRGLAPRALQATLAWGARELGLRQVSLRCYVDNTASRRVAEKCGFIFVGRQGDELHFRRDLL